MTVTAMAEHAWQAPGRHRHTLDDNLAQGTWAPWMATIGTTTTSGSGRTRVAWSASNDTASSEGRSTPAPDPGPPGHRRAGQPRRPAR